MPDSEAISGLRGEYRDLVVDADGRVTYDSGWQHNAIVDTFRVILAAFAKGLPTTTAGIRGIRLGAGNPTWDTAGTPSPATNALDLVDPTRYELTLPIPATPAFAGTSITFRYIDPATGLPKLDTDPRSKIEIVVTLGPKIPPWPDGTHPDATLREFGLVGELNGSLTLLNYRTHPAIARDPFSSLIRTIWLTF